MNAKCASCKNFWGSSEEMEWDGHSIICKYCPEKESGLMIPYCIECGKDFKNGEVLFHPSVYLFAPPVKQFICRKCSERENMPNIKITAEVDGKQVPLETVSTETFEAIKALEKPKEIPVPVARVGNYKNNLTDRRLFLKITDGIRNIVANNNIGVIAINLQNGNANNSWSKNSEGLKNLSGLYENVHPL